MRWLWELHETFPVAQAIAVICLVCVAGMSLGSVAVRGIKLGTSGVIFAAILVGHFSKPIDHATLEFVKEFGLILFVFCIGLQLGPGFFSSLRRRGRRLNSLAVAVVILAGAVASGLGWLLGIDRAAVLGILSGATTNTPSLGAAQQTIGSLPGVTEQQAALPALAYAVTYPAGIVGIIGSLLVLKSVLRINVADETKVHAAGAEAEAEPVARRTLVVENANLQGVAIRDVPALRESGVVVSRIRSAATNETSAAVGGTLLAIGDRILAVGTARGLDQFQRVVGRPSDEDLLSAEGSVTTRRIVVTSKTIVGKTVQQLDLEGRFGVTPTRVARAELEMTAAPALGLMFGDVLQVVGTSEAADRAAAHLGNSLRALNETQFVPLFAGIAAGIALGTLPIPLPCLPHPLRLGLAAGPLIVAIIVGRIGRIGNLVWQRYAPQCQSGIPRVRHRAVLRQRRVDGGTDVFLRRVQRRRAVLVDRGDLRHDGTASSHRPASPLDVCHELCRVDRPHRRQHD